MIEIPEKLNNQAIELASNGSFPEAIACFKRAITLQNNNYLLWFNLGVTYRDAGELEKAKQALKTSHSMVPANSEVTETYANICLTLKLYDKVTQLCYEGLDYEPCNAHLWNLLGVVNFQKENYEEAAEKFEYALYINPYYLDALYNLRDTYSTLKNSKGEKECNKVIKEIEKRNG